MLPAFTGPLVDRSAAPERVGLGMTIVLTLTTHMANANSNLPKTSYPKVCIIFCICMHITYCTVRVVLVLCRKPWNFSLE
jgi:hypothetical protein